MSSGACGGNFVDVPTDSPQRDERLGWTGDLQVFVPTASYLYDTSGMLRSWLADLAAEQTDNDGVVPIFVPFAPTSRRGCPHCRPRRVGVMRRSWCRGCCTSGTVMPSSSTTSGPVWRAG